jgi:bifunctional non-homologous end joining protein LigD
MPDFIEPCSPKIDAPPKNDDWVHEIKFDGYRLQAHLDDGAVKLFTRRGFDWTPRFSSLATALSGLPIKQVILDGELVVPDHNGIPDFHLLEADIAAGRDDRMIYYTFDVLYLDHYDLRPCELRHRRAALESIVKTGAERIRVSEYLHAEATTILELACRMKLEGIVSKRLDAPYRSGEQSSWLKQKCKHSETFPIIAFVEKLGAKPRRIASLYLGKWEGDRLLYAGKAETGFKQADLYRLRERLDPHIRTASPLSVPINKPKATWVEPVVDAEIEFSAYTSGGRLRAPVYKGLRDDLATAPHAPPSIKPSTEEGAARRPGTPVIRTSPTRIPRKRPHVLKENILQLLPDAFVPTRSALKAYWTRVHQAALPYLARRALKLVRSVSGTTFYHKGPLPEIPQSVHQLRVVKREGGSGTRVWIDDLEGLLALVDMDVIEVHPWNSTVDDLEHADTMVFDLDPGPGVPWSFVVDTAFTLRELLEQADFTRTWPKLTGGKGLHVMVPLTKPMTHDVAHRESRAIAEQLARLDPERYTVSAALSARKGKLFLDYLRNGRGTTAVGTYSPRARAPGTIAAPVTWNALEQPSIRPDQYTMESPPVPPQSRPRSPSRAHKQSPRARKAIRHQ